MGIDINFANLPFLRDLISATEAPVMVSDAEDGSGVVISVPPESAHRSRCRTFWLALVGEIYSNPCMGFTIESCTIRRITMGRQLPRTRWEQIKSLFVAVPERYASSEIQNIVIKKPSFRDHHRASLREGLISFLVSREERERLERLGVKAVAVGAPFHDQYRVTVPPAQIVSMVIPGPFILILHGLHQVQSL